MSFIRNSGRGPAQSYNLELARGRIADVFPPVRKFGRNSDIGTTEETIWSAGGLWQFPQAASTVRVKAGGDVADDVGGTGARDVTIVGLDSNWDMTQETIPTNGVDASVATTTEFIRVYRGFVTPSGIYGGANVGIMNIESVNAGVVCLQILTGLGQTQMAVYAVPDGHTAYLRSFHAQVESAKSLTLTLYQRQGADIVSAPFTSPRIISVWPDVSDRVSRVYHSLDSFPARTDIWCNGQAPSGGQPAAVSVEFELDLVKN